jgi:plasmid stability protein
VPTIQVRDVPEDVHRSYRRRAAEAGKSLQEFLLGELIAGARTPTPAELVADVERQMAERGGQGYASGSSAEFVRADRDGR